MTEVQELLKNGKIDEALKLSYEKYNETKDEKVYNLYGIALFKKKMYDEAAKVFGELYQKHPENEKLLINYAQSLIEAGKVLEAERTIREGAMLFPESSKLLELLAECEKRKGLKDQENKEYEKKKEKEISQKAEPEAFEDITEISEVEQEVAQADELLEKIEEIREDVGVGESREEEMPELGKEEEKEERPELGKKVEIEDDKISFEKSPELPDGFLRRARIAELNLMGESDFIARSTFILSVSGIYKVFPVKERQGDKIKNSIFGGREHSFVRIRGERAYIILSAEYISFLDISEIGSFYVLEPYLVGFEPLIRYNIIPSKIKNVGRIDIVELKGEGKVLIFSAGKKFMIRPFESKVRVAVPNFVALYGQGDMVFLHDSVQISGSGKIIMRV